jgi:hypothetical protein
LLLLLLLLLFALQGILGLRVTFCGNLARRAFIIEDLNEVKAHTLSDLPEFSHLQGAHTAHEISSGIKALWDVQGFPFGERAIYWLGIVI